MHLNSGLVCVQFSIYENVPNIITKMFFQEKYQPVIEFKHIGKNSNADYYAGEVYLKHLKPTWTVNDKVILREIKKTEVGKRLNFYQYV